MSVARTFTTDGRSVSASFRCTSNTASCAMRANLWNLVGWNLVEGHDGDDDEEDHEDDDEEDQAG